MAQPKIVRLETPHFGAKRCYNGTRNVAIMSHENIGASETEESFEFLLDNRKRRENATVIFPFSRVEGQSSHVTAVFTRRFRWHGCLRSIWGRLTINWVY
jgi:hypothetical protein